MEAIQGNKYSAQFFTNLFTSMGVNKKVIPFMVAQIAHETNNFTSIQLLKNNNGAGITYINNPYQINAHRASELPEDKNYHYAKFDTIQDFANDYLRILKYGIDKPINSNSLEEFAKRLKNNGFYSDTLDNYTKGLKFFYKKYAGVFNAANLPLFILGIALLYIIAR